MSIVKESVAKELHLEIKPSGRIPPLKGITGRRIRVLGQAQITISSSSTHPITINVAVVPDNYLQTAALLGMNALGKATLTLDYQAKKVHWNNLTYPLVMATNEYGKIERVVKEPRSTPHPNLKYGRLTARKHLDCYSTTMVEVKVDEEPNTVVVVEAKHHCVQNGIPLVMSVTREKTLIVPIFNNTKAGLTLQPGTLLVTYQQVKDDLVEAEDPSVTIANIREAIGPENDHVHDRKTRWEKLQSILDARNWSHLEPAQKDLLFDLVKKHQDLFIVHPRELGLIQAEPAHIQVSDPNPCRTPLYRYPEKAKETIQTILKNLEERGIIESSTAAWLSPIVLVNKPGGEKRLCLDYRKVNKQLAMDIHPLPKLDELVESVSGNDFYATLDMKDAYYQVALDQASRDLTTFSDGISLYRFRRLPFGLSCSPAIFARQMNQALAPLLKDNWVKNYLDDLIVSAANYETLLERLNKLFTHLKSVGIRLNLSKCNIGQRQVKFLGHIVSKEGYRPDPSNIEAVTQMKPPTTLKETRRFIGMCSFYRRHIHQFSKIIAPLTNLTKKGQLFEWTSECQEAFSTLKSQLTQAPVLSKADLTKEFILETDASATHVGAVLMQYEGTTPHVIGFFSKKLRPAELRYSTTDREALAVVLACRNFHHYLWGVRVLIRTDHQPLVSVFRQRTKSPRMNRWILEMREFQFKIDYKSGATNVVADQLSRPAQTVRLVGQENFLGLTKDEFIQAQVNEPRWRELKEYLEGGRLPRHRYPPVILNQFIVEDGVLYYSKQKKDNTLLYLLVVPMELRKKAITIAHEKESGHLGQLKSMLKAEDFFYWPNLRSDVKKFVKECMTCQQTKSANPLQRQWRELPPVQQPLERVSIDITEMSPARGGHRYVLTVVDHFSRFVKLFKLRSRQTEEVVRSLRTYVGDYGVPRTLLADNACEFRSNLMADFCHAHGIHPAYSTPYHPQGNAITERVHRTLKSVLASLSKGQPTKWPEHLTQCQQVLNSAVHETTGEQPHYLMFNRHAPRFVGSLLPQVDDETDTSFALDVVRQTSQDNSRKWLRRANVGRREQMVEIGDLVWVRKEQFSSTMERKLGIKWIGPYKVTKVAQGGVSYVLENTFTGDTIHRASDKIKRFVGDENYLVDMSEIVVPSDDDEEEVVEPRGARPRRPVRRYIEEM